MIPLDDALAYVLSLASSLAPQSFTLDELHGLVLTEPVVSSEAIPPFDNTAMDGFAVRAVDVAGAPVELAVIGTVAAGTVATTELDAGEAYRIMTGAPVPPGADAVVMVEWTEPVAGSDRARVTITRPVPVGNHIRPAGDDIGVGDQVLPAGTTVTPAVLGVLCTLGVTTAHATPRPRVGVCSTGDELVEPGRPVGPGQIRDSNRRTLLAMVAAAGATPVDLGCCPDDEAAIESMLRGGIERCDLILSSGGVSMGDFDFVKVVMDRIGDMQWMQVAIRPAKPLAAGTVTASDGRPVPVVGLPGNPVSSVVSFELFARPLIGRLAGRPATDRTVAAVAADGFARRADGKIHFVRVVSERGDDGAPVVRSSGGQGSHQTAALARADALAVVPDGDGIAPGDSVLIIPL